MRTLLPFPAIRVKKLFVFAFEGDFVFVFVLLTKKGVEGWVYIVRKESE